MLLPRFTLFAVLILMVVAISGYGQPQKNTGRIPEKYWSIDLSAGVIIMPQHTTSPLFGQRPSAGFQESFAVNYAFDDYWMTYAAIGFNYYHNRRPQILDPTSVGINSEDIIETIFSPMQNIKPTIDAGIMYRLKLNNLELLPKLGLSYTVDDWGRNRQLTLKDNGIHLNYRTKGDVTGVKWGINSHYWVSKKGVLQFGVQAEQPLKRPNAEATYLRGTEVTSTILTKSTAYGKNIYFQIGYGFAFAKRYRY